MPPKREETKDVNEILDLLRRSWLMEFAMEIHDEGVAAKDTDPSQAISLVNAAEIIIKRIKK